MPPIESAEETGPISAGIVGAGRWGLFHLERLSLRDDFDVRGFYDPDPERLRMTESNCGRQFTDWSAFLSDSDIELVLATPVAGVETNRIGELLQAGKHVVLEKPFTLSLTELESLGHIAREQNRLLSFLHRRDWDSDFLTARQAVRAGMLGNVTAAKFIMWDYGLSGSPSSPIRQDVSPERWETAPITPTENVLIEFGADRIDQLLQLISEPVQSCFAQSLCASGGVNASRSIDHASASNVGSRIPSVEVHPNGVALWLAFQGGGTAQLEVHLSSLLPFNTGWIVNGTDGGYRQFRRYTQSTAGEIFDMPLEEVPMCGDRCYDELVAHLRHHAPLPIALSDLRGRLRILEAAMRSMATGQVIPIDASVVSTGIHSPR